MSISEKIDRFMTEASWIRRMFEEGIKLKQQIGEDRVFDFSLGNPIMDPPESVEQALKRLIQNPPAGMHRYMPNAGLLQVREKIAAYLAAEHGHDFKGADLIMTVGAAGGLNCALRSLLNPGEQVAVIAPFFPEYRFYIDNHGGEMTIAESSQDFDLDLADLDRVINEKTKAIIINSPNNPTGRMYSEERLGELGQLLADKEKRFGHPITLLADAPYLKVVFDGRKTPDVFGAHPNTILITSHSKDLGLAGERIGYAAISPHHQVREKLQDAMTFTNRTLGFVNAPALFQHVVAETQSQSVSISTYQELRDLFCQAFERIGLQFVRPEGAFYLFPKSPIDDDVEFVRLLQKHHILAVPGTGFSRPGHIRIAFCVTKQKVLDSIPLFERALAELGTTK